MFCCLCGVARRHLDGNPRSLCICSGALNALSLLSMTSATPTDCSASCPSARYIIKRGRSSTEYSICESAPPTSTPAPDSSDASISVGAIMGGIAGAFAIVLCVCLGRRLPARCTAVQRGTGVVAPFDGGNGGGGGVAMRLPAQYGQPPMTTYGQPALQAPQQAAYTPKQAAFSLPQQAPPLSTAAEYPSYLYPMYPAAPAAAPPPAYGAPFASQSQGGPAPGRTAFCGGCGAPNTDPSARFCGACGALQVVAL
jgi:hypothetical protein